MAEQDFPQPPQLVGGSLDALGKAPSIGGMDFGAPPTDFSFSAPILTIPKLEFPMPPKLEGIEPPPEVKTPIPEGFKKDKTVTGFAGNFITDATQTLKGLGHFLFVDLPEAAIINPTRATVGAIGGFDQKWRDQYSKAWSDRMTKFLSDPAGQTVEGGGIFLKALADPYWDFKKDSFKWDFWYDRPFTLLADAATLASLGAGTAGKAANVAGKTTAAGKAFTEVASTLGKADKVLNPVNWVVQGGKKLASPILEGFGIGEHSPALTKIIAETRAEAAAEREMMRGVREIKEVPGGIRTPELLEVKETPVFGALKPQEAADILVQAETQIQRRLKIKGNIDDIEAGRLPNTEIIKDRVSEAFTDIKWRKEQFRRIKDYLTENNILSNKPIAGYEPVNIEGIRDFLNTHQNLVTEFKRGYDGAIALGADTAGAFDAGSKSIAAFTKSLRDLNLGKKVMWAPKHVSNYLRHEFAPRAPGLMDSFFKYWSPAVTTFRFPMYQAQVLAGNSVLSLLYGAGPKDWGMVKKLRKAGAFSPELQELPHARLMDEWARGEGAFGGMREAYINAAKWIGEKTKTSGSDARLRQLIATNYLSKELQNGVLGSIPTGEALEKALTEILASKQSLRDIMTEIKNLKESEVSARVVQDVGGVPPTIEEALARRQAGPGTPGIRQGDEAVNIRRPMGKEQGPRILSSGVEEIKPVVGGLETPELLEVRPSPIPKKLSDAGGKRSPAGAATPMEGRRTPTPETQAMKDAEFLKTKTATRQAAEAKIPDLQTKVNLLDKAIEEGNRWAGNAMALHPFERNVLARIIPFYNYTKAMTSLAFTAPILYPKRMFLLNRLASIHMDMMHDPEAPEWVQEYVPFGIDADGNIMAFRLGSFNPFSGVRGEEFGQVPILGPMDPTRNPIFKLAYEMAGGTPHWTKKPVSPGEYAVRYGDGSTYEYQSNGTFKKIVAQPDIMRSALNLLPQLQALNELGDAYVVDDRGRTILGPDGKPRFPKELWTRLLSLGGARGSEYKLEDLKIQQQKKANSIMNEWRSQLRREMDPERRQQIIDILRDAAASEHRTVK